MCAATIFWGNIGRVVHGASNQALDQLASENKDLTITWTCRDILKGVKKDVQVTGPTDLVIEEVTVESIILKVGRERINHHRIDDGDGGLMGLWLHAPPLLT
jgi:hypothetical protein